MQFSLVRAEKLPLLRLAELISRPITEERGWLLVEHVRRLIVLLGRLWLMGRILSSSLLSPTSTTGLESPRETPAPCLVYSMSSPSSLENLILRPLHCPLLPSPSPSRLSLK